MRKREEDTNAIDQNPKGESFIEHHPSNIEQDKPEHDKPEQTISTPEQEKTHGDDPSFIPAENVGEVENHDVEKHTFAPDNDHLAEAQVTK